MTAPDKITAWEGGTRLSLLGGAAEFQHTYHHQRTVDELLGALEDAAEDLADYSPLTGRSVETARSRSIRALIAKHRKGV